MDSKETHPRGFFRVTKPVDLVSPTTRTQLTDSQAPDRRQSQWRSLSTAPRAGAVRFVRLPPRPETSRQFFNKITVSDWKSISYLQVSESKEFDLRPSPIPLKTGIRGVWGGEVPAPLDFPPRTATEPRRPSSYPVLDDQDQRVRMRTIWISLLLMIGLAVGCSNKKNSEANQNSPNSQPNGAASSSDNGQQQSGNAAGQSGAATNDTGTAPGSSAATRSGENISGNPSSTTSTGAGVTPSDNNAQSTTSNTQSGRHSRKHGGQPSTSTSSNP